MLSASCRPCKARVNFLLPAAGWLEGGRSIGDEKSITDADRASMMSSWMKGVDMSENGLALQTMLDNGPGHHVLGREHTTAGFAIPDSDV